MNNRLYALAIACFLGMGMKAQDSLQFHRIVEHAFTFGAGRSQILDTYLSPIEYDGPQARLMYEKTRPVKWGKGKVLSQTILQGWFAYTKNPARTYDEYAGVVNFNFGWHYRVYEWRKLQLYAGLMGDLDGGCFYLSQNANNPAQGKLYFNVEASCMAKYGFRIGKRVWQARYQLTAPFLGVMFSPQYGQSYYEIFILRQSQGNVKMTWPGNEPSLRHYLSLDIPFRTYSLRLGYVGDFHQSYVNNLKCHSYNHSFMIGVVKHFYLMYNKRR